MLLKTIFRSYFVFNGVNQYIIFLRNDCYLQQKPLKYYPVFEKRFKLKSERCAFLQESLQYTGVDFFREQYFLVLAKLRIPNSNKVLVPHVDSCSSQYGLY